MANKKIAVGAKTTVIMDIEESFGVPPTVHGGVQLPINAFSLKPSRAKNTPNTLTGVYDPTEPSDGNLDVSGAVTVPVDARAFGHWLKAMFGDPTTTGDAAPYNPAVFDKRRENVAEKLSPRRWSRGPGLHDSV